MQSWAEISYEELVQAEVLQTIVFQLIVPTQEEVIANGENLDLSKSDLNACYSRPITSPWGGEDRSWFEVKLTVQGEHNLPPRKEWFYVITEKGYFFKACFSGKKTKKLVPIEDSKFLGFITKGALIRSEIVCKVNFVSDDPEREGIITKEMLERYGNSEVILKKTCKTKTDRTGVKRDIWLISFPYKYKPYYPEE